MAFCAWCGNHVTEVSYTVCPRCGNPTNGSQRVAGTDGSKAPAIIIGVIVGGLVLVAIVGILAAIAIPNFLTAMQRAKQKRSLADMRTVATALESYAVEEAAYPDATSMDDLSPLLVPKYVEQVPAVDGWGTELRYACWPAGECRSYALISAGSDKTFEHDSVEDYAAGTTKSFDADIVFTDGRFLQYPEGIQAQ